MRSTTAMLFVDANVLLYSTATLPGEIAKKGVAQAILDRQDLAVSVQVLQEFYAQATRPSRPNALKHADAMDVIRWVAESPVQEMTLELMYAALQCSQRYQISYWDAAIIEAARALGCDVVLSEDLNDGQDYGGVRVVNPFA